MSTRLDSLDAAGRREKLSTLNGAFEYVAERADLRAQVEAALAGEDDAAITVALTALWAIVEPESEENETEAAVDSLPSEPAIDYAAAVAALEPQERVSKLRLLHSQIHWDTDTDANADLLWRIDSALGANGTDELVSEVLIDVWAYYDSLEEEEGEEEAPSLVEIVDRMRNIEKASKLLELDDLIDWGDDPLGAVVEAALERFDGALGYGSDGTGEELLNALLVKVWTVYLELPESDSDEAGKQTAQ